MLGIVVPLNSGVRTAEDLDLEPAGVELEDDDVVWYHSVLLEEFLLVPPQHHLVV